jgi:DNA-binding PadR family transcriptional regulator
VPRRAEDPKWTDPGLLVMGSLAQGVKHGYAILQDVEATSGVRLGPGTLYGALARLEERGLIEALEASDPRRRPYGLTARGATVLAEQAESMRRFAALSRRRLRRGAVSWSDCPPSAEAGVGLLSASFSGPLRRRACRARRGRRARGDR